MHRGRGQRGPRPAAAAARAHGSTRPGRAAVRALPCRGRRVGAARNGQRAGCPRGPDHVHHHLVAGSGVRTTPVHRRDRVHSALSSLPPSCWTTRRPSCAAARGHRRGPGAVCSTCRSSRPCAPPPRSSRGCDAAHGWACCPSGQTHVRPRWTRCRCFDARLHRRGGAVRLPARRRGAVLRQRSMTARPSFVLPHAQILSQAKQKGPPQRGGPFRKVSGGDLLSHTVARAVPSAQKGLASGFGMEPGVSPSL